MCHDCKGVVIWRVNETPFNSGTVYKVLDGAYRYIKDGYSVDGVYTLDRPEISRDRKKDYEYILIQGTGFSPIVWEPRIIVFKPPAGKS